MPTSATSLREEHLPAGQLLAWVPVVETDPVAHLALTAEAARSLLLLYPPVLAAANDGHPELVGDAALSAGLLKKVPPDTLVGVVRWPEELTLLRVRTHCLLRLASFAERADSLLPVLPSLVKAHSKAKDLAQTLQAHPSQITRRLRND